MRVSVTMSASDRPRPSRAAARVLPRLGSPSAVAFVGSAGGVEEAEPPLPVLIAVEGRASLSALVCLGPPVSVPLRDLAPESVLLPEIISLSELTVSLVFGAVAIHPAPPRGLQKTREDPS